MSVGASINFINLFPHTSHDCSCLSAIDAMRSNSFRACLHFLFSHLYLYVGIILKFVIPINEKNTQRLHYFLFRIIINNDYL